MFRIPRETVRLNDSAPIIPGGGEVLHSSGSEVLHSSEAAAAAIAYNRGENPDYDAVIEASELKLESLNEEIELRQHQLEETLRRTVSEADMLMQSAEANAAATLKKAHDAGYADGKTSAEIELKDQRDRDAMLVNRALREIADSKAHALAKQEDDIVELCFEIVTAIFGTDFERGHEALIRQALRKIGAPAVDDLPADAIFDYEGQTIDASFETQLRKIRDEFAKVSNLH